jgi:HK97 family phage major capsid protein
VPDDALPGSVIGYRKNGAPIRLLAGGDPTHDLTGQLETRRASLVAANRELLSGAAAANNGAGRDLSADEETRYQSARTEIRNLGQRVDDLSDERQREARAAASRADGTTTVVDDGSGAQASGVQVTSEPEIYGEYSPHSYFADLLRSSQRRGDGDGGLGHAEERLGRHRAELRVELPARRERRTRQATAQLEQHTQERLSRLPPRVRRREERMIDRWLGLGLPVFEKRAASQTAGDGGYFIPPLWLVDEYTEYLRAGRVLANLMHSMPLPPGTNSINIPIITTGTGTGMQAGDGAPVNGRDIADNYVNALVKTVAGQEDASMQVLDLSPINMDQVIFKDLTADHAQQANGQVMLGSGTGGQMSGLYPQGTITGGSTPGIIVNGVTATTAGDQWTAGDSGRNDFYSGVGMLASQIGRNRFLRMKDVVTNEAVWNAFATSVDGSKRPLVPVTAAYNPAATGDFDPSSADEGPVGSILGRRWWVDNNIPLTFGGATTNPGMSTLSAGHTSPVDGTGSGDTFTPLIGGVFDDMLLFEGEVRTRVLQEVLSDTLQVRFQLFSYMAFLPNRYQNAGKVVSYGNVNSGITAGAALSTGTGGGLVGF